MGIFVLRMGMIFIPMEYLNGGLYKTPAAPPYLTLLQATTREVTSGTKAVRIVTRLTRLYTEKTS
jgi:hypothetical protein